jgi:hypothetical protein
MKPLPWKVGVGLAIALSACAQGDPPAEPPTYEVSFKAHLVPTEAVAEASIQISQTSHALRSLDINAPANRYTNFTGDGKITITNERVQWAVPEAGGTLRYSVTVDRLRGGVHDTRLTDDWGIFRLDQLFPRANARTVIGAESRSTLALSAPADWSFETPYGPANDAAFPVEVSDPERRFDRPMGWAVAGRLGIRRDRINGRRVAIAAPLDSGFRRQDTLAFLRWTLPTLIDSFPGFPPRLLIVGSGKDMWRGGLSGPSSLYLHPSRPLVSGNATSTLLHELVHVAMATPPAAGDDWIAEGLAEYYSLEILRRTGGISERRFNDTLAALDEWATRQDGQLRDPSRGADTAYAVSLMQSFAVAAQTNGRTLDAVVLDLLETSSRNGVISRENFIAELQRAEISTARLEQAGGAPH